MGDGRPGSRGGGGTAAAIASLGFVVLACVSLAHRAFGGDAELEFVPRNYSGEWNNIEFPLQGSAGTTQIRAIAGADFGTDGSSAPGDDRPTAREVMTEVGLTSSASLSSKSALFVAWGQLLTFDLSLTQDNDTESFDVPCNDADDEGGTDIWCPLGDASDDIPFFRSEAAVDEDGVRNPVNYASSYLDLDFVYGRTADEAMALRTGENGFMNITASGVPYQNSDGTWLIADQRSARYPVTFALHAVLLLEHNRCCVEVAPGAGFEGDEDIYQACRGWTIATFQHVTQNDFLIRLLGLTLEDLGLKSGDDFDSTDDDHDDHTDDDILTDDEVDQTDDIANQTDDVQDPTDDAQDPTDDAQDPTDDVQDPTDDVQDPTDDVQDPTDDVQDPTDDVQDPTDDARDPVDDDDEVSARRAADDDEEARALGGRQRWRRRLIDKYNETVNGAADVFAITAGGAALESGLPGTVRIVTDGFASVDDDYTALPDASADIAGIFSRNDLAEVLRGAVLSPALDIDPFYAPIVSNRSPLFKLPVDAVQRGRDHGLPTYNDAREAYGLERATDFSDVTSDVDLRDRLSVAYGGDIDNLDALTGALAEGARASTGGVFGDLLHEAWSDQLYRVIAGDRFYHSHDRAMEDVANTTLRDLIAGVTNVTDLPLSVFQAATVTVCDGECTGDAQGVAVMSDSFQVSWEEAGDGKLLITLSCTEIGDSGWMGMGWGGLTMGTTEDFVICEVSDGIGTCTDHAPTSIREVPPLDEAGQTTLNVTVVSVEDEWTSVSFLRERGAHDGDDYDLGSDIDSGTATLVIYAYREGDGIGQHPNANRGAATVNFATGDVEVECNGNDFLLVHGSLMLVAWMVLAPLGIYYVRYRKGQQIKLCGFDFEWFEMHQELMIIASEAVLPLAITAVFATGGDHTTQHAHWGFYLIAAVALQVLSGFVRVKGLEAAQANFSYFHRFNKYFHIWAGRFAYLAGVVQCYRGLELVSGQDNLVLSAGDGLDLELSNYDTIKDLAFPIWFFSIAVCFVFFETRKQYRRYFKKGSARLCGLVEVINTKYEKELGGEDEDEVEDRLVPRTEDLPLYTMVEFNEKVLHGQNWVLVDGAILDVTEFSHRHPGGARLILNALGTDITHELLGEDLSVGHAMSFSPHRHPESAWEIVRSLVVGYIDEDEDEEEEVEEQEPEREAAGRGREGSNSSNPDKSRAFRIAGKAVMMTVAARRAAGVSSDPARRTKDLSTLPEETAAPPAGGTGPSSESQPSIGPNFSPTPPPARQFKRAWSSKKLLERYHVCPFLFREKMGSASAVGRGQLPTKRPVYRYVFSCPGQAQALVEAINGVCHFNLRGQAPGKGVIQRSYNAYAVRVQDLDDDGKGATKGRIPKVIPASETTRGTLCIEMRIRIYHDGAMSQLLEKLAKAKDNPAVQLQGPYVVNKLVPPPAHRNVIMVAAGTGVNPMVQQIRDYLALPRGTSASSRSRLSLIWQVTSEAELYGTDEITALQAKSQGLLEVTVLISGDQRRRNIPGAAFKKKLMNRARAMVSPMMGSFNSSASSNAASLMHGRTSSKGSDIREPRLIATLSEGAELPPESHAARRTRKGQRPISGNPWDAVQASKFGPHPKVLPAASSTGTPVIRSSAMSLGGPKELASPTRKPRDRAASDVATFRRDPSETLSEAGGGLLRGKVTKDVLENAFGPALLKFIENHGRGLNASMSSEQKSGEGIKRMDVDAIAGTDTVGGKLQVVVSGPSGFVFNLENILGEMSVPSKAIVLLD